MFHRLSSHLVQVALGGAREAGARPLSLHIRVGKAFPPTHPTTRLCLELLQEALSRGPVGKVLDVGCGAGVLSLAAAALGVSLVVAVDLAAAAVRETLDNARENALAGPLRVVQGSTESLRGCFDLVLANLPWEIQMDKAPELSRLAAPAGSLILAGFRDPQEKPLLDRYQKLGWSPSGRASQGFQHPELPAGMSFTWAAWTLERTSS
jgi:ribosomal protein L11 methyltransferase